MKLNILIISLVFPLSVFSQSIKIKDKNGNDITNQKIEISIESDDIFLTETVPLDIINNSSTKSFREKKEHIDVQEGHNISIGCCVLPDVYINPTSFTLNKGKVYSNGQFNISPRGVIGVSIFKYIVFDVENPSDSAFVEVHANLIINSIKDSDDIGITFYPTPTKKKLTIKYNEFFKKESITAIIHDQKGNEIKRIQLDNSSNN